MKAKDELSRSFSITWISGEPHSLVTDTHNDDTESLHVNDIRKRSIDIREKSLEDMESDVFAKLRKLQEMKDGRSH